MKQLDKEEKKQSLFSPNRRLYGLLLVIAITLTIFSFLAKDNNPVFTIWTSITCGSIASIIVAWLIDEANCKNEAEKTDKNREAFFQMIISSFDTGLQPLICFYLERKEDSNSKYWYEWVKNAYDFAEGDMDFCVIYNQYMYKYVRNIHEKGSMILAQNATLLETGIATQEDIDALSSIITECYIMMVYYDTIKCDSELAKRYNKYSGYIKADIDRSPAMRIINAKPVEADIYKKIQNYWLNHDKELMNELK